jgi:hypothetical protein
MSRLLKALKTYSIVSAAGSSISTPILHLSNLQEYNVYPAIILLTALTSYVISVMFESLQG